MVLRKDSNLTKQTLSQVPKPSSQPKGYQSNTKSSMKTAADIVVRGMKNGQRTNYDGGDAIGTRQTRATTPRGKTEGELRKSKSTTGRYTGGGF